MIIADNGVRYNAPMLVCLFDIDGTLLSSGGAGKSAMEAALGSEFGVHELRGRVPFHWGQGPGPL